VVRCNLAGLPTDPWLVHLLGLDDCLGPGRLEEVGGNLLCDNLVSTTVCSQMSHMETEAWLLSWSMGPFLG
jgi:hypothetical protein